MGDHCSHRRRVSRGNWPCLRQGPGLPARRLDQGQRSREVAETLARRFNELYATIQTIGEEHQQEEDFFRYADHYGEELGLWGPLP